MPQYNSLPRPQHNPIHTIPQRNRQIALPLPTLSLPPQKRLKRRRPTDTPRLIEPFNHRPHVHDPPRTLLAHFHLAADLRALRWINAAHGVELVVGEGGVV